MPQTIKLLDSVSIMVLFAACENNREGFVVVDPEPGSVEPVSTGKYK